MKLWKQPCFCLVFCVALVGCMPALRSDFVDEISTDGGDASVNDRAFSPDTGADARVLETGADASDTGTDVTNPNDRGDTFVALDNGTDGSTDSDTDVTDAPDVTDADTGIIMPPVDVPLPTDTGVDAGVDAGTDVGFDTGPSDTGPLDTGVDVPLDRGPLDAGPADVGFDSGPPDVGFDTGPSDTGPLDTGVDVPRDNGPADVGFDSGPPDVGFDTGPLDTGPACGNGVCGAGENCDNCRIDCGACVCGDGVCQANQGMENCVNCALDCGPRYDDLTVTIQGSVASAMGTNGHLSLRVALNDGRNTPISDFMTDTQGVCRGGLTPVSGPGYRCTVNVGLLLGCRPWLSGGITGYTLHVVPRTSSGAVVITSHDVGSPGALCYPAEGQFDCMSFNCGGTNYTGRKFVNYRSDESIDYVVPIDTVCARNSPPR